MTKPHKAILVSPIGSVSSNSKSGFPANSNSASSKTNVLRNMDSDDSVAVETVPLIRSDPKFVQGRIVLNEEDE